MADQGVHLGHMRLSIIDLAGGAQPMWTADGEVGVVFNGEIYNHAELREELKGPGAVFITDHSDTEVLLQAYRLWGDDFVNRLNGMWAFVIYDRPRRRLFASRDRFGNKPFYYTHQPRLFAFASELSALTAHSAVRTSISRRHCTNSLPTATPRRHTALLKVYTSSLEAIASSTA